MAAKSLKSQNWLYLIPYIALHLVAFYAIVTGTDDLWQVTEQAKKSAVSSLASGVLAVVLNGFLSADVKAMLVFWKLKNPLPGCRAFSKYLKRDPRVDPSIIRDRYGGLPSDPTEENRLWYKIYRQREGDTRVRDAHRNYLATRDLAALSMIFLATLAPSAAMLSAETAPVAYYVGALVVAYLLTSQAARTYGRRFVTTVLAVESTS